MKGKTIMAGLLVAVPTLAMALPQLTFIGHASIKIKAETGEVIYIDPYYPVETAYGEPADYILITHAHRDHNCPELCAKKEDCKIIKWSDALVKDEYKVFEAPNVKIEAVPSGGNKNHSLKDNVGFIVTVNGVSVYHGGDTSFAEETKCIAQKKPDYALYSVDGFYTKDPEEATRMADFIGARVNIPIHGYGKDFEKQAKQFHAKGTERLSPGQTIALKKSDAA